MPRPHVPVSAFEVFRAAESYLKLSNEGTKAKEENGFSMALTEAIIANHAFACELYMKCIYALYTGNTYDSHSLWKIFDDLSADIQNRIQKIYNDKRPKNPTDFEKFFGVDCDLQTAMQSPENAYELFRYAFEPPKNRPKSIVYRLGNVLYALRKYILEIQPDWPVLNGPL